MVEWIKHVTREMSLTAISYAFNSYINGIKDLFGFNFNNIIYFISQGQIEGYKDPDEIKRLKSRIADIAIKNPENIKATLNLSKRYSSELNNFISNATANLPKYTNEKLALLYKEFDAIYTKFWAYYLFHFYLIDALKEAGLDIIINENKVVVDELRRTNPYLTVDQEFLKHLFNELAKRKDIEKPEILYYSLPHEIINSLEGKSIINIGELNQRKNSFLFFAKEGKKLLKSGDEALKEKTKEIVEEEIASLIEIKGQVACRGKAIGNVKIVTKNSDFAKLENKNILVAHMTTVDYIPLLNKVSAIVTDEGGFGCHAAILSREFKIPCIIGTKIATKVLKDSDLVEVDADKGIVKIIKKIR